MLGQQGAIVVRLGTDTLSVERFTRTAGRMEGDVVRRIPAASQWHYVVDVGAGGYPTRLELTPVRASQPGALFRVQRLTMTFTPDSVFTEILRDTLVRLRAAARGGFPIIPEAYGFAELWAASLRTRGVASDTIFLIAPLGGPSGKLAFRVSGDSAIAIVFGSPIRMRFDAAGRLLAVDGTSSTLKYVAERVAGADLDRAFASLAARDSARGAPGAFLTGRDTARATVGGAQLRVDYGRPSLRGRNVFANGVLGDTLWRTGANAATQFRTDRDLEIGGRTLAAGLYTLWTHWSGDRVELVINAQTGQWGTQYDPTRDVMRVPLTLATWDGVPAELFTIAVSDQGGQRGQLQLMWDTRRYVVPFTVAAVTATAAGAVAQPAQHGASPTVSPDGRLIAFASDRDGTGDVFLANADGSEVRRLTTDGGHHGRAYWSADGRRLLYGRTQKDTARLFSLPVEGGAPAEVARTPARGGAVPFPDGARFVAGVGEWTTMQLVASRLDGSGRVPLTSDRAAYWCPAVSPRGDRVAAARNDSTGMQIWIVGADGSGGRALTRFTPEQGRPQCPAFSADGRRLAVQSDVDDPRDPKRSSSHIWVVDVATGQATRLAEHAAAYHDELPVWFPDGRRIAFQSDRTGSWEVWVMNADGTGAWQLTR
jgi:hypothetical protein